MDLKNRITRRRFLILVGGAISLPALSHNRATAQTTRQPAGEFIESRCEKEGKMKNRILIAYGSRCGSTGGVAEAIGQSFCENGTAVDVLLVKNVSDLSPYQGVLVGSAIRMGRWLPEVVEFVKTHQNTLSRIPVAYFVVCLSMKDDTAENRRKVSAYLEAVRKQVPGVKPVDIGLFAGAVDFSKLSFSHRLMLKVKGAPEGDFRNWNTIRSWAVSLRSALGVPRPSH